MGAVPGVPDTCDLAVVGGGIVGLAAAWEVLRRRPGDSVVVLERAPEVATGQTGANSGVVHAGVYYAPGSLKARLCVEGARRLYEYCDARGIPARRSGKLVLATGPGELGRLDELERRARANGVPGLERLGPEGIAEREPHARGVAALWSPRTGVVDFAQVARALAADVEAGGGTVLTGAEVRALRRRRGSGAPPAGAVGGGRGPRPAGAGGSGSDPSPGDTLIAHARGELRARRVLVCAGHAADRLAVGAGAADDPRIVGFRGSYARVREDRAHLVRSLVYPVPDPALPFLGVHLTRTAGGEVLVGPTALLVPTPRALAWPGTWRVVARFRRAAVGEAVRSGRRRALAAAGARLVPGLAAGDLERGWAGTRAQAVARDGALVDDFSFSEAEGALHVRNAPSPAATSALAIASELADRLERKTA